MANSQVKSAVFATAIAVAGILAYTSLNAHKVLSAKIDAQVENIEVLRRFSATNKAAEEGRKRFDRVYKPLPALRHNLALLNIADFGSFGVETDTDNLVVRAATPVLAGDVYIGLVRACLTTGVAGADSLFLRAPNYQVLQSGIDRLAARADIEIGSITLVGSGPFPIAKLRGFCILMRES